MVDTRRLRSRLSTLQDRLSKADRLLRIADVAHDRKEVLLEARAHTVLLTSSLDDLILELEEDT